MLHAAIGHQKTQARFLSLKKKKPKTKKENPNPKQQRTGQEHSLTWPANEPPTLAGYRGAHGVEVGIRACL